MQVGIVQISSALKFARFFIRATHARVQSRGLDSVLGLEPRVVGDRAALKLTRQLKAAKLGYNRLGHVGEGRGIARCNKVDRLFVFVEAGSHKRRRR